MSFASVCVIVACLIIMGSFTLLVLNVNNMIEEWESENQVVAFVDEALTDEEARALEARIESIDNVSNAVFVSRDDAFAKYLSDLTRRKTIFFPTLSLRYCATGIWFTLTILSLWPILKQGS